MEQSPTWRRANESFSEGATRAVESNSGRVCASLDERRRPEDNGEIGRKRNQATERIRSFRNSLTPRNKALVVASKRRCANFSALITKEGWRRPTQPCFWLERDRVIRTVQNSCQCPFLVQFDLIRSFQSRYKFPKRGTIAPSGVLLWI